MTLFVGIKAVSVTADFSAMDGLDIRRSTLARAITEPQWRPAVASDEGEMLRELAEIGWVIVTAEGDAYRCDVTDRGLDRHHSWA